MLGGGKRRCYLDAGFVADRISRLPCIVKDHILSFLPLREAAKTSVLSTEWRHDWTYRPILYFDDNHRKPLESLKLLEPYDYNFYQTLLDVLCILKLHRGPLREFALVLPELEEFYDLIDQIMCHLDGTHMESFSIDVKDYILPISCISTFSKLRELQLSCCQFASSAIAFGDSFPLLTVLELTKVTTLLKGGQVSFSYKCPLLEDLTMDRCCEDDDANKINIVIEAPSLHSFRIVGSFNLLEFKHTPLLKRVSVQQGYKVLVKNQQELLSIFEIMDDGFPTAKPLSVFGYFYQYLKVGSESAAIVKQNKLSHLTWNEMTLNSSKQCPVVGLLNYSYDLEELIIDMTEGQSNPEAIEYGASLIERSTTVYKRLKRVKLIELRGTRLEMASIRRLLAASSVLERVDVHVKAGLSKKDHRRITAEFVLFRRPPFCGLYTYIPELPNLFG